MPITIMGRKPRSSKQLEKDIVEREQEAYRKVSKKYGDRGRAGQDMINAENKRSRKAQSRDLELVRQYGVDAPKARSFGTDKKQYSVSRTKTARARKPSNYKSYEESVAPRIRSLSKTKKK